MNTLIAFIASTLFNFSVAHAEDSFEITTILNEQSILLESTDPISPLLHVNSLLVIKSQETRKVLGYAHATRVDLEKKTVEATVHTHSAAALIRIHDRAEFIDLTQSKMSGVEMNKGRQDLIVRGDKNISSKYKPQVYIGAIAGQTAGTLEDKEWLLGPSLMAYGMNERWQLATLPYLDILGEVNTQIKYKIAEREDYRVSISIQSAQNFSLHKPVGSGSIYWDTYSNSKFSTYHQLQFSSGGSNLNANKVSADLSITNSYITDSWNRFIFGPNLNFERRSVGGLLAYHWVWDQLTASISAYSGDFTNIRLGDDGYLFLLDFWYRF